MIYVALYTQAPCYPHDSFPQRLFAKFDFCYLLYSFMVRPAPCEKSQNLTFPLHCIVVYVFLDVPSFSIDEHFTNTGAGCRGTYAVIPGTSNC